MCELFGASLRCTMQLNAWLKEFYSHSVRHPHGWGLVLQDDNGIEIEKEPLQADKSHYLHARLSVPVSAKTAMAHIRYATIGNVEYPNCHPYTGTDLSGRKWILMHNGTIFDYEPLTKYGSKQVGDTDSERILLYILDQINEQIRKEGTADAETRFRILDSLIVKMAAGNKLNLILYDGECMYIHTNYANSLHFCPLAQGTLFSTEPLSKEEWEPVPMTTLLGYREGKLIYTGTNHGQEYLDSEENMKYLYQIFSTL